MKRVLVTGAYGFAGSHVVEHIIESTDWEIVCLYSFRHLGCPLRSYRSERVQNIFHDLNAPISCRVAQKIGHVDYIIHLAAQSHVERSIEDPVPFVQNNINATLHMLEFARMAPGLEAFLQISTDEVYGPAMPGDKHEEWREMLPSNPYAASKVGQEALAISYWRTYGVPVMITNTMNMVGPRQDTEKYLPMLIKKMIKGEEITIHGKVGNIGSRQYLHARSHADALIWLIKNKTPTRYRSESEAHQRPDRFNVVGEEEVDNLSLAKRVSSKLGTNFNYRLQDFHSARPGHDRRYALDGGKIAELGWKAPFTLDQAIEETIAYMKDNPEWQT
jgi:dTDP-glucose 4,6-dehydratase